MLNVEVEDLGNAPVLRCQGQLVHGEETRLLCAVLAQQTNEIVLDLGEIDRMDASGRGALLALQAAGIYLILRNPSASVRNLLRMNRMDSLFEACEGSPLMEHGALPCRAA